MPMTSLHKPRISVIIPHLNQPQMLARCLEALQDGSRPADEIIVVDNGSDMLPDVPDHVTLLQEMTPGPGPARNLGVAHATGDVLAFIDADCLAQSDWLAVAEQAIVTGDILGGDVRIAYDDPDRLTVLEAYESIYAFRIARYIAKDGFAGTGNLVMRRAVCETVGPFAGVDTAEDRDWGQRATGQGFVITYVPQMRVYHPARSSFAQLYRKWDRQLAHDYGLINDRAGRLRWMLKTLLMGLSPLAEIPRIAVSDRVPRLWDKVQAFAGLCRIRAYRARRMVDLMRHGRPERFAQKWNR